MNEESQESVQTRPETVSEKQRPANSYMVPAAIVFSGVLIAGAVLVIGGQSGPATATGETDQVAPAQEEEQPATDRVRAVSEDDHIKGSLDAAVTIVEYSDFECPFCKRFHDTMNQVVEKYGDSGEVAWVYRHFPLEQLHPVKARAAAVASECAAEQGGNDAFWAFTDGYFDVTLTNNRTDIETVIPQLAREIGLDEAAFEECRNSGRYDEKIQNDIENAVESGGRGTPWSVVIGADGTTYPLSGAQPISAVEQLIDIAKGE